MHLCDGKSNFEIAKLSKIDLDVINESIQLFEKKIIKIKQMKLLLFLEHIQDTFL